MTLARVFDIDNDNLSDIVSLDSAGEINIYYADVNTDLQQAPTFTKSNLESGL